MIILYLVLMLGTIALGGWAIEGIFKQSLKNADDRVARFEQQLKDKHDRKN